MRDILQEALHILRENVDEIDEARSLHEEKLLTDLYDQVYSSLTDAGVNDVYKALGQWNGKNKYAVDEIGTLADREGFDTIEVCADDLSYAEDVAAAYGLDTKLFRGNLRIYVPENSPVNVQMIEPEYRNRFLPRKSRILKRELVGVTEDVESSMPVNVIPHDDVYDYIANVPEATSDRPPFFFPVGYIKELGLEIPSKFRGGRGSEGESYVRIFKCSEMTVYTGADYENLKATKAYRKETGIARSGERTGFNFNSDSAIIDRIGVSARGEEQLQCYIRKGTKPKAKYFISLDNEDLREASKEEVAQYLTPAHANRVLGNTEVAEGPEGAKVLRLKLSGIYRIGNLGSSIM